MRVERSVEGVQRVADTACEEVAQEGLHCDARVLAEVSTFALEACVDELALGGAGVPLVAGVALFGHEEPGEAVGFAPVHFFVLKVHGLVSVRRGDVRGEGCPVRVVLLRTPLRGRLHVPYEDAVGVAAAHAKPRHALHAHAGPLDEHAPHGGDELGELHVGEVPLLGAKEAVHGVHHELERELIRVQHGRVRSFHQRFDFASLCVELRFHAWDKAECVLIECDAPGLERAVVNRVGAAVRRAAALLRQRVRAYVPKGAGLHGLEVRFGAPANVVRAHEARVQRCEVERCDDVGLRAHVRSDHSGAFVPPALRELNVRKCEAQFALEVLFLQRGEASNLLPAVNDFAQRGARDRREPSESLQRLEVPQQLQHETRVRPAVVRHAKASAGRLHRRPYLRVGHVRFPHPEVLHSDALELVRRLVQDVLVHGHGVEDNAPPRVEHLGHARAVRARVRLLLPPPTRPPIAAHVHGHPQQLRALRNVVQIKIQDVPPRDVVRIALAHELSEANEERALALKLFVSKATLKYTVRVTVASSQREHSVHLALTTRNKSDLQHGVLRRTRKRPVRRNALNVH